MWVLVSISQIIPLGSVPGMALVSLSLQVSLFWLAVSQYEFSSELKMDNTDTQKTQPVCANSMEGSHQILKKGPISTAKWPSHQNDYSFTPEDDVAAKIFR